MTIQQGNNLSQEMVAQLKLGMTREQVRFVLGTPLSDGRVSRRPLGLRLLPRDPRRQARAAQPVGGVREGQARARARRPCPSGRDRGAADRALCRRQSRRRPPSRRPLPRGPRPKRPSRPPKRRSLRPQRRSPWRKAGRRSRTGVPPAQEPGNAAGAGGQREAKKPEDKKADESAQKPAAEAEEPGFFGRLRQKMGL